MKISLEQLSKRYRKHIIFRNVNFTFEAPHRYAILGANGSGKSTLMRSIAGMQNNSAGQVIFEHNGQVIEEERQFQYVSYAAPGMELIEEMTLKELLHFHFTLVPILPTVDINNIIELIGLEKFENNYIEAYSSGMKQRVKLALAIFTNRPVLLLDEPCSNLDTHGVSQYLHWMATYTHDRLVIVASNEPKEYPFCNHYFHMSDWT